MPEPLVRIGHCPKVIRAMPEAIRAIPESEFGRPNARPNHPQQDELRGNEKPERFGQCPNHARAWLACQLARTRIGSGKIRIVVGIYHDRIWQAPLWGAW